MNLRVIYVLFVSCFTTSLCAVSYVPTSFEFKQAVGRYIKHTDAHCLQHAQRCADENIPYKKELRYLFKNYGTISTLALLSRIRSAHQEMVKIETDVNSDTYKRYEQISSALLLVCVQSFVQGAYNQILNTLNEIDQLIMYWRYQRHHQISYFFGKSPTKWIMGKPQAKEIANNLARLEYKQRQLYTLLGALAEHAHALTTCNVDYDDCYAWMNELLSVVSYNHDVSSDNSDYITFDDIAARLALKIKKMDSLSHDVLRSLGAARKPSHFVQHWIAYTAMLVSIGSTIHYDYNHDGEAQKAFFNVIRVTQDFCSGVVVDRVKSFWRAIIGKDSKKSAEDIKIKIDGRVMRLRSLGLNIKSDINQELAKSVDSLLSIELNSLYGFLEEAKNANCLFNDKIESLYSLLKEGKQINFKFEDEAKRSVIAAFDITQIDTLTNQMWYVRNPLLKLEGGRIKRALVLIRDILYPLMPYVVIADESIAPAIQEGVDLFADIGEIVGEVAEDNLWTSKFTALIPLISTGFVIAKTYKWATARDYSPIRIALADINSLLIESATQFNNCDYGKLLYLVFKLRHKTSTLKDPLADEFLEDVAKLELKQYSPEVKRGIVDNMFNKYAFLGRIAA